MKDGPISAGALSSLPCVRPCVLVSLDLGPESAENTFGGLVLEGPFVLRVVKYFPGSLQRKVVQVTILWLHCHDVHGEQPGDVFELGFEECNSLRLGLDLTLQT
jgi:hypothetical protein